MVFFVEEWYNMKVGLAYHKVRYVEKRTNALEW